MVLQRGRHWRPGHCAGIAADAGVARRARRRRVRGCGASHPVRPGRGPASARTCGRRGRRTGQNRLTRHRSASWRRLGQRILDPGHANDGSTDHTIPGSTSQDRPKRNQRSSDRYHRSRNGGYRYRCARYRYRSAGDWYRCARYRYRCARDRYRCARDWYRCADGHRCSCRHWPRRDERNTSHVSKCGTARSRGCRSTGSHRVAGGYRRVARHALDARVATRHQRVSRRVRA
ncbi:Uncharacterised protein [Mycobacterium tuberculosis]|nr:Uncharacterised protein [Mycobacterium tuberculosis]CLX12602.1 Uncharacterised protein [Mycobacterium tuberculosis]CLY78405.1 Uncharacterised protein [Mycobacterium tuberculosis]